VPPPPPLVVVVVVAAAAVMVVVAAVVAAVEQEELLPPLPVVATALASLGVQPMRLPPRGATAGRRLVAAAERVRRWSTHRKMRPTLRTLSRCWD
jgi:hypothetical protein